MNETIKTNGTDETETKIKELTENLADDILKLVDEYSKLSTDALGETYRAGIHPYLREVQNGAFRPDVKVVIVKIKDKVNDNKGEDSTDGGDSKGTAGGEEPTEAPVTTG